MKRIVVCMDGTWQSLHQQNLTNIGIIARSVAHKETRDDGAMIHQTVIYTHGVGSSIGALAKRGFLEEVSYTFNRLAGGAFGEGLEDGIVDTYLRLAFDYEAGDEIYIFGFSRGAFAARRLAGLINTAGIVSRRHTDKAREGFRLYYRAPGDDATDEQKRAHAEEAAQFRRLYGKGERNPDGTRRQTTDAPRIKYLGVFDTVAQRGFAEVVASMTPWHEKRRFSFVNNRVCPNVDNARHAVAIDECRIGFPCSLWEGLDDDNKRLGRRAYEQRWFIGTHGDVGGGESSNLSAAALKWITEGAAQAGLRFYATYGEDESPLNEALRNAGYDAPISRPKMSKAWQPVHYPLRPRRIWRDKERPTRTDAELLLDEYVFHRTAVPRPRYRPSPLKPFQPALKEWLKEHQR
ncbi:MAG TPA: DUF2235 domain-containing protein [Vitreimonas sp.]|uniref:DUF2235 domain-containing protein n=1 Tax=Vitreimonas sp. TaxID=3069702 RepID=UPI002D5215FC|nr:DUF2235 domain-containing protein [Vitreimonas sp.]HYD89056.1 DUF2235 domain-containing protein [Vitreimonas sp.]